MNPPTAAPPHPGPASSPSASRKRRHDSSSSTQPEDTIPSASAADPKRVRLNPPASIPTMSAKLQGKRPEVIDLTGSSPHASGSGISSTYQASNPIRRPIALQSHMGPRKLVIKNLRPANAARAQDVSEYYARARAELDAALDELFAGKKTTQPMERLYRGVEDICRTGAAAELAEGLKMRCDKYLAGEGMLGGVSTGAGDDIGVLRQVLKKWEVWVEQIRVLRWIYGWLDRSYLLTAGGGGGKKGKGAVGIEEMGVGLFRGVVFGGGEGRLGKRVLKGICELVRMERDGKRERLEEGLLREGVAMLHAFGVYGRFFERMFLAESHAWLKRFAEENSAQLNLKGYITHCRGVLESEKERCRKYAFDSATTKMLVADVSKVLIEEHSAKLLESGNVARLLDDKDTVSLRSLYQLLELAGIQKQLRGPWEEYIKMTGSAIVSDKERGDEMVIRLLELRRTLDLIIQYAFGGDEVFTYGLREAFAAFINDKNNTKVWSTGSSKVGEMIAKHIDLLLRGGLKTLPQTTFTGIAEVDGGARMITDNVITGDEDAQLDQHLDKALELFRFVEGKDVFEAFYKKDLARRLLMGRSASQDAERNMLSKLKNECGSSFTHNLEKMFKDQELAKDEMASYKTWLAGTGRPKGKVDLSVSVLTAVAWPTYPDVKVLLPKEVMDQVTLFDTYYKAKHTGRRLTWKHNLAHCVVRARFDRGPKELLVSAFQAVVLNLFNDVEGKGDDGALTYHQIAASTGLTGGELDRTLQSLACGKVRVLVKQPKGREVKNTDIFTVNKAFHDPKFRVKINQIQLKETREEVQETHKRVAADRQYETQAAIVRIMKSRKTMTHAQLVAEVINQTKNRGMVDTADIKTNIEKLIEKEYLEREDGSYVYLA